VSTNWEIESTSVMLVTSAITTEPNSDATPLVVTSRWAELGPNTKQATSVAYASIEESPVTSHRFAPRRNQSFSRLSPARSRIVSAGRVTPSVSVAEPLIGSVPYRSCPAPELYNRSPSWEAVRYPPVKSCGLFLRES